MWPFNKEVKKIKPKVVPKVNTQEIVYEVREFEIGRTFVELEFIDKTKLIVSVTGAISQYVCHGLDEELDEQGKIKTYSNYRPVVVTEPNIINSEVKASEVIQNFVMHTKDKFYDQYTQNYLDRKEVIFNKLKNAKLMNSEPCKIQWQIAKLQDKK